MPVAIRFENVSKRYRKGAAHGSLRDAIAALPQRLLNRDQRASLSSRSIWALREVSFKVSEREVLGIIGPNGAGKTTMLKLLSRVTKPTSGVVQTSGRVSALIELGAGFHPDLTGRENIYLNGVILGLSRTEIARKFDSIVAFSELEEFIDTPVKRYSSGMYVRLGFAVAAHVDPDIMLVDEVLAVGDHAFRVRCIDRFKELQNSGVTTVVVSHNRHLIESLCSRAIYLNHGEIMYDGEPGAAWDAYLSDSAVERWGLSGGKERPDHSTEMTIESVGMLNIQGEPTLYFSPGEPARAYIEFQVHAKVENPVFYARLYHSGDLVHGTNTARFQIEKTFAPGDKGVAWINYEALNLLEGTYELGLGIEKSFFSRACYDRAPSLYITMGGGLHYGVGLVHLKHEWKVDRVAQNADTLPGADREEKTL